MPLSPLLQAAIEDFYDITLTSAVPGPAGMTGAGTFVLTTHSNQRYFCKRITDPVMQRRLPHGLAAAQALADYGLSFVTAPVTGHNGDLCLADGNSIVALFPFIDATPTRDYDAGLLGAALGAIHSASPFVDAGLHRQGYTSVYDNFFQQSLWSFLQEPLQDETPRGTLRNFLAAHENTLRRYIDIFLQRSSTDAQNFVITHGDVQANVLQAANGALHLIDWDEAEVAPPERDLWFLAQQPGFMAGYTAVRPQFTPDPRALVHGALKAWLEGFAIQATAILDGRGNAAASMTHLRDRRFSTDRLARLDAVIANI